MEPVSTLPVRLPAHGQRKRPCKQGRQDRVYNARVLKTKLSFLPPGSRRYNYRYVPTKLIKKGAYYELLDRRRPAIPATQVQT